MVADDLAGIALDLVAVEHQDHLAFLIALVIAENVLELGPGSVQVDVGKLL